ncbi:MULTISPECIES: hypothetical protein [Staphylococcus]|jgi:hypothetical protein|nr:MULTISPECIES: hypothetical protein [Staphylococcus]
MLKINELVEYDGNLIEVKNLNDYYTINDMNSNEEVGFMFNDWE